MSEFLGARISLISRSDIRYVGTLHEINSDDSTVSLENVKSFGTEGRKGKPDEEVSPSDQVYEYIVFRGTDVKDLRIEEGPAKENNPPAVPNDPAIVGARARPNHIAPVGPPPNAQGPPGGPGAGYGGYYPPHMGGWGRGGPPGPGPAPYGGMQYPPPPGWFPPGQGFAPPGPGPWSNHFPYPPGPGGPPGAPGLPGPPAPNGRQGQGNQAQDGRQAPIGESLEKQPSAPAQQSAILSEPKSFSQAQPASARGPPPPVESKPSAEEVKATATFQSGGADSNKSIPTGPKGSKPSQILPAVPLPAALTAKAQPTQANTAKSSNDPAAATAAALRDATQAAKAAVAVAMAKLEAPTSQHANGSAMDNLTNKVNEMRVNAPRTGPGSRGGRGRGPRPTKVEVPETDFDFASSNAKFNKQVVAKEAIAGSPLTETANGGNSTPDFTTDSSGTVPVAYNKSSSFFDNISSEAKDRTDNNGQKPGGREWRGEEQRRNIETFGQGSVDGGFRGGFRGRGRGRGGGRGRGFSRGGRGGSYHPRDDAQTFS